MKVSSPVNGPKILEVILLGENEDDSVVSVSAARMDLYSVHVVIVTRAV